MKLSAEISPELWDAVAKPYLSELYSNAVVEAIHYLSTVLRERANVDGDGISLVGQALGGDSPKLRINKFQTPSEKDEQKGFEQIVRGIYQGIRNPRSHEQYSDSKSTGDAIILFIDYILGVIGKAKQPFELDEWVARVFDPSFFASRRYAKLLVAEVPPKKQVEALIHVYRKRGTGNLDNLIFVFRELLEPMDANQLREFIAVVSDDLKVTQNNNEVISTLRILRLRADSLWPLLDEAPRLRIENNLIRSIEEGRYDSGFGVTKGGLGTWAMGLLEFFSLKGNLSFVLLQKLEADEAESRDYVARYFLAELPRTMASEWSEDQKKRRIQQYAAAIAKPILDASNASFFREQLIPMYQFAEDWQNTLLDALKPLDATDNEYYQRLLASKAAEDIPF